MDVTEYKNITHVENISSIDNILITSTSYEDRCLGFPELLSEEYIFQICYLINYDTINKKRDANRNEIIKIFEGRGNLEQITTNDSDPTNAMSIIYANLKEMMVDDKDFTVDLDISTLNKKNLFMILKYIDDLGLWNKLRIFYTEPKEYITDLYLPMSSGLRDIRNLKGYISKHSTALKKLLIIFLGYEGDRSLSIFENEDPDEVILVAANPPYRKEWVNKTETMNKILIRSVGRKKVIDMDSKNPFDVLNKLTKLLETYPISEWRWSIVPIGTKPQTLGIYYFWRSNPYICSIIYASPLRHNHRFYSTGVGKTWLLKEIS